MYSVILEALAVFDYFSFKVHGCQIVYVIQMPGSYYLPGKIIVDKLSAIKVTI